MAKGTYKKIEGVFKCIKNDLDRKDPNAPNITNIITIYAHNGSGKTRLSKLFQDKYEDKILCYNAFLEDFFYWDNDNAIFKIDKNSWVLKVIKDEGLNSKIIDNFKDFTGTKIEPDINTETGNISFKLPTGDTNSQNNIKISRGEESIFVWTVFYSILEVVIEDLNEKEGRSIEIFNNKKYIIIDDPVSSMDDTRIIAIALKVANLMQKSKNYFDFLITTHHPLFFNVLFCNKHEKWNKTNYILYKSDDSFRLKKQCSESPFAYHHVIISEIKRAIDIHNLKKYHFNLFRCLLEKTANFLGYNHWKKCLNDIELEEDFLKIIDHYSHDRLAELEYNNLTEANIEIFKNVFESFYDKYKWSDSIYE